MRDELLPLLLCFPPTPYSLYFQPLAFSLYPSAFLKKFLVFWQGTFYFGRIDGVILMAIADA